MLWGCLLKLYFKYGIDNVEKAIVIVEGEFYAGLTSEAIGRVYDCRAKVEIMAKSDKAVSGINTGFGPLCNTQISPEQTSKLQENLLITHAVGVGSPIDKELSEIMMAYKVHTLCSEYFFIFIALCKAEGLPTR